MPIVAYLANQFPSRVEPYVAQEIQELRKCGVTVIPCSARHSSTSLNSDLSRLAGETLYLQTLKLGLLIYAAFLCLAKFPSLKDFFRRALFQGHEPLGRRLRAVLHTWLGVYFALLIEESGVQHIHVHHGYFASWIAMVAARVLEIDFSMTLHGSDLLIHAAYLDIKLENCKLCLTISEFNRQHILKHHSTLSPDKVVVRRMGIYPGTNPCSYLKPSLKNRSLFMLAVGRLHPVKDHAFLIRACKRLKNRGVPFTCVIAGEGPERTSIETLIGELKLEGHVGLAGHLSAQQLDACYAGADLVVLTSRSEGIPLVLMEAMVRGKPVLAPAITGIPELVIDGQNGFLYSPGSLDDFVARVQLINESLATLGDLRRAAQQQVLQHFNREKNLAAFCQIFLTRICPSFINSSTEGHSYENPLLQ
jgi:glycosyltransferase involved in cell wall biosynthesis